MTDQGDERRLGWLGTGRMGFEQFTRYKSPAFVSLDFQPTLTASLLRKDFDLGLAAAREREVPLPVASLVHQLVQSLVGHGHGDDDFAALLQLQADSAGLKLESERAEISDGLELADMNGANDAH
jgi:3-hydroxyisobutyrate dehydrogenase